MKTLAIRIPMSGPRFDPKSFRIGNRNANYIKCLDSRLDGEGESGSLTEK
jgi:hypothetical protein